MSERAKIGLLSLLLLVTLLILTFTAVSTIEAMRSFQQQYSATKTGDVKAVHPWMTVHVISHIYHVPENYLSHSLQLTNTETLRHETLYQIAQHKQQPVDNVVKVIQRSIITYRKEHTRVLIVLFGRPIDRGLLSPPSGRM